MRISTRGCHAITQNYLTYLWFNTAISLNNLFTTTNDDLNNSTQTDTLENIERMHEMSQMRRSTETCGICIVVEQKCSVFRSYRTFCFIARVKEDW